MGARIQRTIYGVLTLCVSAWAGSAVAAEATAYGPICDTTYAKVACPAEGVSNALYVSNNTCGTWSHRGMLMGYHSYTYHGGCANVCSGSTCNGGAGNYYVVTGSFGWDFRQLHFNADANSYSRGCDRCYLGLVGATGGVNRAYARAENRQYGTRMTAWFALGTGCGSSGHCVHIMGNPTL